jgi:hypothetical protein
MSNPSESVRARRVFIKIDQIEFAKVSGDHNPMHLDEIFARRTNVGRPSVHGIHIALWMLDWYVGSGASTLPFLKISARFNRPLFLDEVATIEIREGIGSVDLLCMSDGAILTQLKLSGPAAITPAAWTPSDALLSTKPAELAIEAIADRRGDLAIPYNEDDIARLFPMAIKTYGPAPISHLLALTRIVGMEMPGLHSLFGAFSVEIGSGGSNRLNFSTARVNFKTSHVQIRVESDVLTGSIDAFVRPQAAAPTYRLVSKDVRHGEFSGRNSLIVGGSRGLGLVSAYILSAGGANVVITYKVGRAEAEEAVAAIRSAGGKAAAMQLDVGAPAAGFASLAEMDFSPNDLYYFATPHIFERKKALFEPAIFDSFAKCYVTDFATVIDACSALSKEDLFVFYPSSDALNHPIKELVEYTAAKAAGESFCEMISRFNPRIKIVKNRLPRLPTDQTATLMKIGTADPAQVMLGICRAMGPLSSTTQASDSKD